MEREWAEQHIPAVQAALAAAGLDVPVTIDDYSDEIALGGMEEEVWVAMFYDVFVGSPEPRWAIYSYCVGYDPDTGLHDADVFSEAYAATLEEAIREAVRQVAGQYEDIKQQAAADEAYAQEALSWSQYDGWSEAERRTSEPVDESLFEEPPHFDPHWYWGR